MKTNTSVFIVALGNPNEGGLIALDSTDDKITCYTCELTAYRELADHFSMMIASFNDGGLSSVDSEWAVYEAELTETHAVLLDGNVIGKGVLDTEIMPTNQPVTKIQTHVDFAAIAINTFVQSYGAQDEDPTTKVKHLLSSLLHYCDSYNIEFHPLVEDAGMTYLEEVEEDEKIPSFRICQQGYQQGSLSKFSANN